MKLNLNKICLIILLCFGIALGCFASAISLLTDDPVLQYGLLILTYFQGFYLVKVVRKYETFKKTS